MPQVKEIEIFVGGKVVKITAKQIYDAVNKDTRKLIVTVDPETGKCEAVTEMPATTSTAGSSSC